MDRRHLITLLGGATLGWPLELRGQAPGRTYRLGILATSPHDAPHFVALFGELRRLGFIEGQNLTLDPRDFQLPPEQFAQHAAELVKAPVDVILPFAGAGIRAAQQATATIPILAVTDDMVGEDLARSLAHPGGNTTGLASLPPSSTANDRSS
jgi:putative tryptophan/tyrosine transport system substrate-binding protein